MKELARLQAVDRFLQLNLSKEKELEEIASFAAKICGTPIALITLIGEKTQYFKVAVGTEATCTSREDAFCNHVIGQDGVLVIPDTAKDIRFMDNPLRSSEMNVQFYAGAPLVTQDGLKLGSLCVIGHEPNQLSELQVLMLDSLSGQVINILEFDYSLQIMKEQYQQARRNEITLKSLFESSKSCLLLVDLDLRVLFYNKVLSNFMKLNYNRGMKAGAVITDVIGDDFIQEFLHNFRRAREGEAVLKETVLAHGEQEIWWQFTYDPAYNAEGEIIGVSYSATDISDLKNSQLKIIDRDRSLHAIALIQSHEIRRPVASILGLAALFKANDYQMDKQEVLMLERAIKELDAKIYEIVDLSNTAMH